MLLVILIAAVGIMIPNNFLGSLPKTFTIFAPSQNVPGAAPLHFDF